MWCRKALRSLKNSCYSSQKFSSAGRNYNFLYGFRKHTTISSSNLLKHSISIKAKCFSVSSSKGCIRSNSSEPKSEVQKEEPLSTEKVKVIFVPFEGEEIEVEGNVGQTIMTVGIQHNVGMEGACEGQLACTTCHVYADENYDEYYPPPTLEEEDMLDIAPFLKANSRLSCQLVLKKELEGAKFHLPSATTNFSVDGFKPKH